jgi:hypothetical protein
MSYDAVACEDYYFTELLLFSFKKKSNMYYKTDFSTAHLKK